MQVEKIELLGFKSFAEKTSFHLHPGITCIVGPNGAGKSNIVDSFRWVLGEQSAKSLRGNKMEEVIFSGSATKKPKGMAEVNLHVSFDTSDSNNGEGKNITVVTRRLYRSGESEYLVNKRPCRLKDIRDLFLDSGLEVMSYSILEQGRIGDILNSKPQDRRFLIEEVAGVMKYKVRKAEAISKLELSKQNLQRINDIISEVKRQINSLDRQVKRAERFKRLSSEIREIELKIARRDYTNLKDNLLNTLAKLNELKEEETILRSELNRLENDIEKKRIGLVDKEKHLNGVVAELARIEREMAGIEREIAVSKTEINGLEEYLKRLSLQEIEVNSRLSESEKKFQELDHIEEELTSEIEVLRESMRERSDSIRDIEVAISDKEEEIEDKRKEIFRIAEEISHKRNDLARTITIKDNLEKRLASISKEKEDTLERLRSLEEKIKETGDLLSLREGELLELKKKKELIALAINEDSLRIEELRDDIARLREELASSLSRLESLKEIMHEEVSIDSIEAHLPVISTIADIIDVEESFERAIENVLSEKIKTLIVGSTDDILKALADLGGVKRVFFIAMDLPELEVLPFPENDAIIGRAGDFVRVQNGREDFLHPLKRLLHNVFIIKDIESIKTLIGRGSFVFVTLEGIVVEPTGAISAGEGKGILRRKREIREIEGRINGLKKEIQEHEKEFNQIELDLNTRKMELKKIDSLIVETEKEISLLRLTVTTQEEEKERINRKKSHLLTEIEEVKKEIISHKDNISLRENELSVLNKAREEAERELSEMQDDISRIKKDFEQERMVITDLRLSLNSCKEKLDAVKRERESLKVNVDELHSKKDGFKNERDVVSAKIKEYNLKIGEREETLKSMAIKADSMKLDIYEQREEINRESEEIAGLEQRVRSIRLKIEGMLSSINESDILATELRLRLENIENSIMTHYGVDISTVESGPVEEGDEERLKDLKVKIHELGPVNLGTLEEYEELKNRYSFLVQQQEDLNKSIAELEEAITRINSITRKKLIEAFEQLNLKFSEVFLELFGSGKAGLVLTDENNILESGIDIIVQPPGKKVQNINLLSGGEKALTALAILFAGFLIKPSPICILDEVDAALDDSNIERFSKMLKRLSSQIQFIVVTHNRVTMEAGDYIYGITMEEPGVSKVISMQLTSVQ